MVITGLSLSSCTENVLEDTIQESITETSNNTLPQTAKYDALANHTTEALPIDEAYANFVTGQGKAGSCIYTVHEAHLAYHAAYVTWFYNPTKANKIQMDYMYCLYLQAYALCYGTPVPLCNG